MKRARTLVAAALASCCAAVALASPALASDPGACAPNGRSIIGMREYQCTLWRGNVPVYGSYSTDPRYGGTVVGRLNAGGRANWFLAQCVGNTAWYGQYFNYWWAYTLADNGRWGYVPLTYFAGGGNNQGSAVLPLYGGYTTSCGGGSTHPSGG